MCLSFWKDPKGTARKNTFYFTCKGLLQWDNYTTKAHNNKKYTKHDKNVLNILFQNLTRHLTEHDDVVQTQISHEESYERQDESQIHEVSSLNIVTRRVSGWCNSFGIVCVCTYACVCLTLTGKRTDIQTWFLAWRSSGRISRSSSKVKVIGQRSRSQG